MPKYADKICTQVKYYCIFSRSTLSTDIVGTKIKLDWVVDRVKPWVHGSWFISWFSPWFGSWFGSWFVSWFGLFGSWVPL